MVKNRCGQKFTELNSKNRVVVLFDQFLILWGFTLE
jgi:hypothetical protein